jgi:hypothetical protein
MVKICKNCEPLIVSNALKHLEVRQKVFKKFDASGIALLVSQKEKAITRKPQPDSGIES